MESNKRLTQNFFYNLLSQLGFHADSNDLDHLLDSLPWILKETKPDGTQVWEITLKNNE
jgi:hypothetical protein